MLDLEKNFSDQETLKSLYRIVHTIKGSSSVIGWKDFETYVHSYEDLLSQIDDRRLV